MARVQDAEPRNVTEDDFTGQAKEFVFVKKQLDYFEKKSKELREKIFSKIDKDGEVDSEGHVLLAFDEPIDGVYGFKKQRRVSRKINEELAEELIIEKGLEDKLYKTIRVVDEDALMAAMYSAELTEEEVDSIYPLVVSWAIVLNKK
jgi:bacterioferritin (cytochrome b1)